MNFTANQLTNIIKACSEANVSSLEIGEIKLQFDTNLNAQEPSTEDLPMEIPDQPHEAEVDNEETLEGESIMSDEDLSDMMINDPVSYENYVMENS